MVKKGRGFNIAAGVLDIILSVGLLGIGFLFFLMAMMGSAFGVVEEAITDGATAFADLFATFAIVFALVAVALFVVVLILGILILKTANATPKDYYKKTGRMLGIAIVMTILVGLGVYGSVSPFSLSSLISVLSLLTIIAMHWAGYGMAKHASKKYASEIAKADADQTVSFEANKKEEIKTNDEKVEKLEKLAKLKEAGIITAEDFEKMKEKIINE